MGGTMGHWLKVGAEITVRALGLAGEGLSTGPLAGAQAGGFLETTGEFGGYLEGHFETEAGGAGIGLHLCPQ